MWTLIQLYRYFNFILLSYKNVWVLNSIYCNGFFQEKESWDMITQEKIEAAGNRKEEGNVLFKAGKYARASKKI